MSLKRNKKYLSYFRFSLFILLFFPLLFAAILAGKAWAWAYLGLFIVLYILADIFLPTTDSEIDSHMPVYYEVMLLAHIPLSFWLLLLLFWQLNPTHEILRQVAQFTANIIPFFGNPLQMSSGGEYVGAVLACGFMFGHNTAVAHELMHRNSRFLHEASRFLFAMCGDAQVVISHIHSHHIHVATLKDPTSAPRGESIYVHFVKAIVGQYLFSHNFEAARLKRHAIWGRVLGNMVFVGMLMTSAMLMLAYLLAGLEGLVSLIAIIFIAKWLLEAINYVQHYGLVRVPGSKIENRHSWETGGQGSCLGLYNATCHAGHHVSGSLPFWRLTNSDRAPSYDHGYMVAIILAMLPPVWFSYVSPMLTRWDSELSSKEEQAALADYLLERDKRKNTLLQDDFAK